MSGERVDSSSAIARHQRHRALRATAPGGNRTVERERLTPPCGDCGLPLIRTDKHCPRCGRAV